MLQEPAVGVEIVVEQHVDRTGHVTGHRVDRLDLAGIAGRVAAVDDHPIVGEVLGDVDRVGERIERPIVHRPFDRGHRHRPVFDIVAVLGDPCPDPTIEQCGGLTEDAQHPHEPTGEGAATVVVGDHGRIVGDTEVAERLGEVGRRRQRVSAGCSRRGSRERVVE